MGVTFYNQITVIQNSFALIAMVTIMVLFVYHSRLQNRPVTNILVSGIWGILYAILAIVWGIGVMGSEKNQAILRALYLACLSLQAVFFYLFMENSKVLKPRLLNITVILVLFAIQLLAYNVTAFYKEDTNVVNSEFYKTLDTIGFIALNLLPLFVYGFVGIPIYYHMYKYTREKTSLTFFIAFIVIGIGYFLVLLDALVQRVIGFESTIFDTIKEVGDILPIVGLMVIMIVYAFNIRYIYRLPYDHFLLMVSHDSGLVMLSIPFQTKEKSLEIEENLFGGMMSALKTVYNSVLESGKPINQIVNDDVSILMEKGKYISAIVATHQVSGVLAKGLKIFVERFEGLFGEKLKDIPSNLEEFESGKDLFMRIFPFLIRK